MNAFDLAEGYVITLDESAEQALPDGRQIHILPYYSVDIVSFHADSREQDWITNVLLYGIEGCMLANNCFGNSWHNMNTLMKKKRLYNSPRLHHNKHKSPSIHVFNKRI